MCARLMRNDSELCAYARAHPEVHLMIGFR